MTVEKSTSSSLTWSTVIRMPVLLPSKVARQSWVAPTSASMSPSQTTSTSAASSPVMLPATTLSISDCSTVS